MHTSTNRIGLIVGLVAGLVFGGGSLAQNIPASTAPAAKSGAAAAAKDGLETAAGFNAVWSGPNRTLFDVNSLRGEIREDASWKPSPALDQQLEAASGDIERIIELSKAPAAEWGVRTKEEGFEAKAPHWALLTSTGRVLFADGRRLAARGGTGDLAAAVERAAASIRLANHFAQDHLLGAVRTGRQVAALGIIEAKRLGESKRLDEDSRKLLLEALKTVDVADPLGMCAAFTNEGAITAAWARRVCTGPEAGKTFVAKFAPRATEDEKAKSGLLNMDEEALHRAVDGVALCYKEVVAHWDQPDSLDVMRAIEEQRKAGDFGAPAQILNTDLLHQRVATYRFLALTADAIKALGGTPTAVLPTAAPRQTIPLPPPAGGK